MILVWVFIAISFLPGAVLDVLHDSGRVGKPPLKEVALTMPFTVCLYVLSQYMFTQSLRPWLRSQVLHAFMC